MDIGIAFDLRSDFALDQGAPEDRLEEYDSRETVDALARALESCGHRPRLLGGGRRVLEAVLAEPPDLVFNIAEGFGTRSREAHVPAVAEMLGLRCTHSDPLTCALTLDKAMAKRIVGGAGVPTPAFHVVEHEADLTRVSLPFPVIAKPLFEGSSMGIRKTSRVTDAASLYHLVTQLLRDYSQPVLVESFCSGPEFTVGVLGTAGAAEVLGIMEIVPRRAAVDSFVYSLEVKRNYRDEVSYAVPPERAHDLVSRIADVALGAYRALGCRDVGRVDVRLDARGEPMFLEVNPLPGLHPVTGDIVIIGARMGMPFEQLIDRVVQSALAR